MEIYHRYAPALLRKGQRILGNRQDAEDVVHGIFVELLSRGVTEADLPYLYRAVTNRCASLLRDRGTRARLRERYDESLRGPVRTRCDEMVIGLDLLEKLAERLGQRDLEVLVCRYFDDLTQEEIAHTLALSRKTVTKRLARIHDTVRALAATSGVRP
ncbi:MAG: sigma-70 family RNA polymerase sigma factor [Myxococcales bacterium]|nr:sigma-70 family RNA polymerase sigma factor [Myxococcales bacterium]